MAERLSEKWSKIIHRMGREREDKIINGKTKLTVAAIFLMDDNWMKCLRSIPKAL